MCRKAIYQLEKHRTFPNLVDKYASDRSTRSNKIPWAERGERGEHRERVPNYSGRSWYNGGASAWRGSSKGSNQGPFGAKGGSYYGKGEDFEGPGKAGSQKGRAEGKGFWQ